ncbi:MAG: hypothetical protein KJO19_13000, partial [Woeseia sp.]|nr:hypothetical protein [Woeseia sp.]
MRAHSETFGKHDMARIQQCCVLLFMLLASACVFAADTRPMHFDQLTASDGLSQSSAVSIAQDARGIIWIGTENGLNRFDGYEFEQFRQQRGGDGGLKSDFIYDIANAEDGGLWIATNGGGLAKLELPSANITSWRHDPQQADGIAGNVLRTVLADSNGFVWLGLRDAGLDRFDPRTETFTHYALHDGGADKAAADSVYALLEDSAGDVWVGSDSGLYRLNTSDGSLVAYRHDPQDETSLSGDRIRVLHEDRAGNLWVGTYGAGLNRLDRNTGKFQRFAHDSANATTLSHDRVTDILEDRNERLWIATAKGLNLYNVEAGEFTRYTNNPADPHSLGADAIASLYEDRSGILWVGTLTNGISKWNPQTWGLGYQSSTTLAASEDSKPSITSFAKSADDTLYIGTFGDGLIVRDTAAKAVTRYKHDAANPRSLSDNRIMSLAMDRAGKLWVGTMSGGLDYLDPATGSAQNFRHDAGDPGSLSANGIMSVFEDSNGNIWAGTFGGGISVKKPGTDSFLRYAANPSAAGGLSSSRITSFAEAPSGHIWIGTDAGGLNLFDPKTGEFHVYRSDVDAPRSLASDTVYALHVDAKGSVWVGTRGGGLDKVVGSAADPDNIEFLNVSQKDGLANDVIYGIQSDDTGRLWLSTNFGISVFDPADGTVKNMHRRDGLQSEEFNFGAHYQTADGQMYFGGINGFNVFDPDQIETQQAVPPVVLTGFYKSNDPIKSDLPEDFENGLELSHRDDRVSFEVAALDYAAPQQNRYKYQLEGFDEEWIDLGTRRRITYTDLDDGDYVLRVQAANSAGVWNTDGLALPITVKPAPWHTWWAY